MFKKGSRVLYMGAAMWWLATVKDDQKHPRVVYVQPDAWTDSSMDFAADPNRLISLPAGTETIEQAVQYLQRCGNF